MEVKVTTRAEFEQRAGWCSSVERIARQKGKSVVWNRIALRDETEWVETVQAGWNVLAGADTARITAVARPAWYRDGRAAGRIVRCFHTY